MESFIAYWNFANNMQKFEDYNYFNNISCTIVNSKIKQEVKKSSSIMLL